MVLHIPQPETAVYRSRSRRERWDRAKRCRKKTIIPPPYRSRGHREGSDVESVSHGADVLLTEVVAAPLFEEYNMFVVCVLLFLVFGRVYFKRRGIDPFIRYQLL